MTTPTQEIKVIEAAKTTDLPDAWRGYPKALYSLAEAVQRHHEKTGVWAETVYSYERRAIANWCVPMEASDV